MCSKWRLLDGVSLFAVLALTLTSCMRVQRAIHLNEGGSGTYTRTAGFQEPRPNDQTSLASSIVTTMDVMGWPLIHLRGTKPPLHEHRVTFAVPLCWSFAVIPDVLAVRRPHTALSVLSFGSLAVKLCPECHPRRALRLLLR